jgi:hypothetical protein
MAEEGLKKLVAVDLHLLARSLKSKTRFSSETGFYDFCNKQLHVLFDLFYKIAFWLCAY